MSSLLSRLSLSDLNDGSIKQMYPNASFGIQSDLAQKDYESYLNHLYECLDKIFTRISFHPIHRENDSEDRTSLEIINILRFLRFPAEHESSYGGNCDIVINRDDEFIWLGEAKKDTGNHHIMEGFRQLVDRYATNKIMKDGALLIYCRNNPPSDVIAAWEKYLKKKENQTGEYSINFLDSGHDYFITSHFHKANKTLFTVKHIAISFYDVSSDRSARAKKKCNSSCEKCCNKKKGKA